MNNNLIFSTCALCQKSYRKSTLFHINDSSVVVNDEALEISNLILDTCFVMLDDTKSNYLCNVCYDNLISFHLFKRYVKKYENFINHLNIMEILVKLETFLDNISDLKNLKITQNENNWNIAVGDIFRNQNEELIFYDPDPSKTEPSCVQNLESTKIIHPLKDPKETIKQQCKLVIKEDLKSMVYKCSYCTEIDLESHLVRDHVSNRKDPIIDFPTENNCEAKNPEDGPKRPNSESGDQFEAPHSKKRKCITIGQLQDKQIEWIREQTSKGRFIKGGRKYFKCPVCQTDLSTQASLIRHLRDVHLLKDPADETVILKSAANKCKITNVGDTTWKCQECKVPRVYTTEHSFKKHFRLNHIRTTNIDNKLIAECRKITEDYQNDIWKCPECLKEFRYGYSLKNHLKSFHPVKFNNKVPDEGQKEALVKSWKCDNYCQECGVKFVAGKNQVKPKRHRECHKMFKILAPMMPHHKCDKCRTIFSTEATLFEHLQTHDNPDLAQIIKVDGLLEIGATYCTEPQGDADDSCLDEAVWKCGHCTVRYFEENDCIAHQMLLHSATIYCFIDNLEFQGIVGLSKFIQHMKNKHPELFPNISYTCTTCQLEFPTIYEKLAHQKLCDLKKYECDYCSKKYSTKHQLQAHMLFEIGLTGYACEKCGRRFRTMSDLKIHSNIHTGLRPYRCSLCDKTFKTPAARSCHMEKHTHEEGIECEICGTKLTNRSLYQRHKRFIHNQEFRESQYEKNFCEICDKSFLRNAHFKQHMKQQHGMS